jgi:hypothetical protein
MRIVLVVLAIMLRCLSTEARAQAPGSPQALQAAQELVAILSGDMIGQMSQAMTAQIWPRIEGEFRAKVDQATMDDLRNEFQKALERFTVEAMKDAPVLYAKHFSAPELRDIVGFYRSPTGAKALQLMPTVMAEFFGTILPRMDKFGQELQATLEAVLKRHGYNP